MSACETPELSELRDALLRENQGADELALSALSDALIRKRRLRAARMTQIEKALARLDTRLPYEAREELSLLEALPSILGLISYEARAAATIRKQLRKICS